MKMPKIVSALPSFSPNDQSSFEYREVEDSANPGFRGHHRVPVKRVFSRAIEVCSCDQTSQDFAVSAHKVNGSNVKSIFATESLYTTGKQAAQQLVEM